MDSVKIWLETMGVEANDEEELLILQRVKEFALENKCLLNESDLRAIVNEVKGTA